MKKWMGKSSKVGKVVQFELQAEPNSQVCVVSTFNNWDPLANPMKDDPTPGHYQAKVSLRPGRYEYKFIVNGAWCADPKCTDSAPDGFGSSNSVITL